MTIRFDCTMCGRCCHDLKLPMSAKEATAWLTRGGEVQLLCEAFVWPPGQARTPRADYGWRRSFAAISGKVPVRIGVTLVGAFEGACPYLLADKRCGGYEDRPNVCRIYPAEINPFVTIDPARKLCPSESWSADRSLLAVENVVVDDRTGASADAARRAGIDDVAVKTSVCALLGIADASFANEGLTIHTPPAALLLAALRQATDDPSSTSASGWRIVTNRPSTLALLGAAGADAAMMSPDQPFRYHGFFAADEPIAAAA